MEQNLAAKKFTKGKPGKSAPAKLIPSKSPVARQEEKLNQFNLNMCKGFLSNGFVISDAKIVISDVLSVIMTCR